MLGAWLKARSVEMAIVWQRCRWPMAQDVLKRMEARSDGGPAE